MENTPKMQKVRNDPFLDNTIFKRRTLYLIKDDFFEDVFFDYTCISFYVQFYKKSILPHKWDTFGTDSM